jgi:oryzin
MKFSTTLVALVGAILPFAAALPTPAAAPAAQSIPGKYIITLKPELSESAVQAHATWAKEIHARSLARRESSASHAGVEKTYTGAFSGYAGGFDAETIAEIKASPDVSLDELRLLPFELNLTFK